MKLTWLGHACFMLESDGYRILLDPYRDVPGLENIEAEADAVYCSHGHFDHAYLDRVHLTQGKVSPFTVREILTFHDEEGGALRGSNMIRCFTANGFTVAHFGDLGHQLSDEQVAAIGKCDVILLPIGGTYTVGPEGAKAVVERVDPRVVIPMHYRDGARDFEELCSVEEFLSLFPKQLVRRYPYNSLQLLKDTPKQVAVLKMNSLF